MQLAKDYPIFCPNCGERRNLSLDLCVRCGLDWKILPDPAHSMRKSLASLSNTELLQVLKMLYPCMLNIISIVAKENDYSIGHVQRVLQNERRSAIIDQKLVGQFRKNLESAGIAQIIGFDPVVPSKIVWRLIG